MRADPGENNMMKRLKSILLLLALVTSPVHADWEGTTEWSQAIPLSTAISGVVSEVNVHAGDQVKRGQLLLKLDQQALRAHLSQREAELNYRRLQRAEAGKELDRAEELYERTLLADHELDLARIADARAEAELKAVEAALQQSRLDLKQSELRAPFDGRVLARHVHPGQTVVTRLEAPTMLLLAESGYMQARFELDAEAVAALQNNQPLRITVAGKSYTGNIVSIDYHAGRYQVRARFATDQALMAGLAARIRLP